MSGSRTSFIVVAGAILVGGLFVAYIASPTEPAPPGPQTTASRPTPPVLPIATNTTTPSTPAAPPAPKPTDEATTTVAVNEPASAQETTLAAIQELAITYDAASIPALAKFLSHADPEVRAAARDGLITLGERAAIPALQSAARTAPPDEARALIEAAEFLALPTLTEHRAAQKAAKAGTKVQ